MSSMFISASSTGLRQARGTISVVARAASSLTHVDAKGRPSMVDVGAKPLSRREAQARCRVVFPLQTIQAVTQFEGRKELISKKGPVFSTAIVAGVMGAKKTSELLPFCHPISLDDCQVDIHFDNVRRNEVVIDCVVRVHGRTGVEMEALTGASTAALCIYDMCKATSHDILIKDLQLISKSGGKRDIWRSETITSQWPGSTATAPSASSSASSSAPAQSQSVASSSAPAQSQSVAAAPPPPAASVMTQATTQATAADDKDRSSSGGEPAEEGRKAEQQQQLGRERTGYMLDYAI